MKSLRILLALTISSLSLLSLTSCATNSGTGALIGGAGGAAVGAAVDKNDRGRGAVIGGAAGAVTGPSAAPGGRPRRLLVFAPRGVRAGGTWQMLRAHLRQNHSAMYSSQTEQSSSPIVRAASPRPPHPGLAPCAGRPAAACRLPGLFER